MIESTPPMIHYTVTSSDRDAVHGWLRYLKRFLSKLHMHSKYAIKPNDLTSKRLIFVVWRLETTCMANFIKIG